MGNGKVGIFCRKMVRPYVHAKHQSRSNQNLKHDSSSQRVIPNVNKTSHQNYSTAHSLILNN